MRRIFNFVIAAAMCAVTFVATSCDDDNEETTQEYLYTMQAATKLNMTEGFKKIETDDPRYIEAQAHIREILFTKSDAEGLVYKGIDSAKVAAVAAQHVKDIDIQLRTYEQTMKEKGITLAGEVSLYGSFSAAAVLPAIYYRPIGTYVASGNGNGISITSDDKGFYVKNANGKSYVVERRESTSWINYKSGTIDSDNACVSLAGALLYTYKITIDGVSHEDVMGIPRIKWENAQFVDIIHTIVI